jgi:predicted transcriptional regulator
MAKKRERLEVIHDILQAVRSNANSIKPTRLLQISNLSPQMFREYTEELMEKRFLREEQDSKGRKTYSLTDKGFEFLEKYQTIVQFIDNFGL